MDSFKLVCERPAALEHYQVVDIDFSRDGWFVLSGIIPKDGKISGRVFRSNRATEESVEGFCGTFLRFSFSTDLFYAYYTKANGACVNLVDLHNPANKISLEVFVSADQERDFPIYMTKHRHCDMVYVVMKSGHVHVYDVPSKSCIGVKRVGDLPVFKAFQSADSDFVLVNREGVVMSFSVQVKDLPEYLSKTLGMTSLAVKYCTKHGLECSDEILVAELEQNIESGNIADATRTYNMLTSQSRDKILASSMRLGDLLLNLANEASLSPRETEAVLRDRDFTVENHDTISACIAQGKMSVTERIGDHLSSIDPELAMSVYIKADVHEKVVPFFVESRNYAGLRAYIAMSSGRFTTQSLIAHAKGGQELVGILEDILTNDYPLDPLDVFETAIGAGLFDKLAGHLVAFTKKHKALSDCVDVNTELITLCLKSHSGLALEMLTRGDNYDRSLILNHPDLKNSWKCEFVLCGDDRKVRMALELAENDDVLWCVSNAGRSVGLEILRQLLRSRRCELWDTHYVSLVRDCGTSIDVDEETRFLDEIDAHILIPSIADSLSKIKTVDGQKKVVDALILGKLWERLEGECFQTNFIDPRAIADLLVLQAQDPVCLIIVCERYEYYDVLVNYLVKHSSIDHALSYLVHIREELTCDVLKKMLEFGMDPHPVLNHRLVLSNYELLLSCSEMLLSMQKYDVGVKWACRNADTFSDCPLLSTIFGHYLIASDGSRPTLKALEKADFGQLADVSRSLQHHEFELICSWKMGEFSRSLEIWEKLSDHRMLLDLVLDDRPCFEPFWTQVSSSERLQGCLARALAPELVLDILVEKMNREYTNFICRLIKLDVASLFQSHFMGIIGKSLDQVGEIAAVELISFALLCGKSNWDLVAGRVAESGVAKKCIDCLLDLGCFDEASFLLQTVGDHKASLQLLLYKVRDLDKAIGAVRAVDQPYAWRLLGEFLIETEQFSNHMLCESLVKGKVFLEPDNLLKCESLMDAAEFHSYMEFGWNNGHQTLHAASHLAQRYLGESRRDSVDRLIDTCTSSPIVRELGIICYHGKELDLALKSFIRSKSADWASLTLARLGRLEEAFKFVLLQRNQYVLLFILDQLLAEPGVDSSSVPLSVLTKFLVKHIALRKCIINLFANRGHLQLLLRLVPLSSWDRPAMHSILTLLIHSEQTLDHMNFEPDAETIELLFRYEQWRTLSTLVAQFSPEQVALFLGSGFRHISDDCFKECLLRSRSAHVLFDLRPDVFVEVGCVPTSLDKYSYWIGRRFQSFSKTPLVSLDDVLDKKDDAAFGIIHQACPELLASCIDDVMPRLLGLSPSLVASILAQHRMFAQSIQYLLSQYEFTAAVAFALTTHRKECCMLVMEHMEKDKNFTLLFVAAMAFYKVISADVVIELAWRNGEHNKFVPFICQKINET